MWSVFIPLVVSQYVGTLLKTKILLPQVLYKGNGKVDEGRDSLYSWQFTISVKRKSHVQCRLVGSSRKIMRKLCWSLKMSYKMARTGWRKLFKKVLFCKLEVTKAGRHYLLLVFAALASRLMFWRWDYLEHGRTWLVSIDLLKKGEQTERWRDRTLRHRIPYRSSHLPWIQEDVQAMFQ